MVETLRNIPCAEKKSSKNHDRKQLNEIGSIAEIAGMHIEIQELLSAVQSSKAMIVFRFICKLIDKSHIDVLQSAILMALRETLVFYDVFEHVFLDLKWWVAWDEGPRSQIQGLIDVWKATKYLTSRLSSIRGSHLSDYMFCSAQGNTNPQSWFVQLLKNLHLCHRHNEVQETPNESEAPCSGQLLSCSS